MIKLANQVIDAYDDVLKDGLKKLAAKNPDINIMSHAERKELSDTDFALSVITKKASKLNKFPINDHDNTWLSNEYFQMTAHRLPKEAAEIAATHIKQACERFKIKTSPAVEGMAKKASDNIYLESEGLKPAHAVIRPDLEKIAQVEEIGDNYTLAQFAFATPSHIKIACDYFETNLEKIPLETRHKYAAAIQKRAAELGMPTQQGAVIKYASDHYSPQVDAHLRSRLTLLEVADPVHKDRLDKLAAVKTKVPPSQFAQLLHAFDKQAKLDRYYGGYLMDPYLATFAGEPDPYEGYRYKTANAKKLTAEEIRSVIDTRYDQIKDYFGKSLADEMKKEPIAIFDSLPNDAKELIAGMLD